MKNGAYQKDIKCSPCEAILDQPVSVGKTLNLPNDAVKAIFTEEELEKTISREQ